MDIRRVLMMAFVAPVLPAILPGPRGAIPPSIQPKDSVSSPDPGALTSGEPHRINSELERRRRQREANQPGPDPDLDSGGGSDLNTDTGGSGDGDGDSDSGGGGGDSNGGGGPPPDRGRVETSKTWGMGLGNGTQTVTYDADGRAISTVTVYDNGRTITRLHPDGDRARSSRKFDTAAGDLVTPRPGESLFEYNDRVEAEAQAYKDQFTSLTGSAPTGNQEQDTALWDQSAQRHLGNVQAWEAEGEKLYADYQQRSENRLTALDAHPIHRPVGEMTPWAETESYQQWLASAPTESFQYVSNPDGEAYDATEFPEELTSAAQSTAESTQEYLSDRQRNEQLHVDIQTVLRTVRQEADAGAVTPAGGDPRVNALVSRMEEAGYSEQAISQVRGYGLRQTALATIRQFDTEQAQTTNAPAAGRQLWVDAQGNELSAAQLDALEDRLENDTSGTVRFAGNITQDEQGNITFSETPASSDTPTPSDSPTSRVAGQPTDTDEFDPGSLSDTAAQTPLNRWRLGQERTERLYGGDSADEILNRLNVSSASELTNQIRDASNAGEYEKAGSLAGALEVYNKATEASNENISRLDRNAARQRSVTDVSGNVIEGGGAPEPREHLTLSALEGREVIYINGEAVNVAEYFRENTVYPDAATSGVRGRTQRIASNERSVQDLVDHLDQGFQSGAVKLTPPSPSTDAPLTRADLGETFSIDGTTYNTESWLAEVRRVTNNRLGPAATAAEQERRETAALSDLNKLRDAGRFSNTGEATPYLPEYSRSKGGLTPLDFVPGASSLLAGAKAQGFQSPGGPIITAGEQSQLRREAVFAAADLAPLPVSPVVKGFRTALRIGTPSQISVPFTSKVIRGPGGFISQATPDVTVPKLVIANNAQAEAISGEAFDSIARTGQFQGQYGLTEISYTPTRFAEAMRAANPRDDRLLFSSTPRSDLVAPGPIAIDKPDLGAAEQYFFAEQGDVTSRFMGGSAFGGGGGAPPPAPGIHGFTDVDAEAVGSQFVRVTEADGTVKSYPRLRNPNLRSFEDEAGIASGTQIPPTQRVAAVGVPRGQLYLSESVIAPSFPQRSAANIRALGDEVAPLGSHRGSFEFQTAESIDELSSAGRQRVEARLQNARENLDSFFRALDDYNSGGQGPSASGAGDTLAPHGGTQGRLTDAEREAFLQAVGEGRLTSENREAFLRAFSGGRLSLADRQALLRDVDEATKSAIYREQAAFEAAAPQRAELEATARREAEELRQGERGVVFGRDGTRYVYNRAGLLVPLRTSIEGGDPRAGQDVARAPEADPLRTDVARAPEADPLRTDVARAPEADPLRTDVARAPEADPLRTDVARAPEADPLRTDVARAPEADPLRTDVARAPEADPLRTDVARAPEADPLRTDVARAPEADPLRTDVAAAEPPPPERVTTDTPPPEQRITGDTPPPEERVTTDGPPPPGARIVTDRPPPPPRRITTGEPPTTTRKPPVRPRPDDDPPDERNREEQAQLEAERFPRLVAHEETVLDVEASDGTTTRVLVDVDQPGVVAFDANSPDGRPHLVGNQVVRADSKGVYGERDIFDQPISPLLPPEAAAEEHPEGRVETVTHTLDVDTGEKTVERYREPRREGETLAEQLQRTADEPAGQAPAPTAAQEAAFDEAMDRAEAAAASGDTQAQAEAERDVAEVLPSIVEGARQELASSEVDPISGEAVAPASEEVDPISGDPIVPAPLSLRERLEAHARQTAAATRSGAARVRSGSASALESAAVGVADFKQGRADVAREREEKRLAAEQALKDKKAEQKRKAAAKPQTTEDFLKAAAARIRGDQPQPAASGGSASPSASVPRETPPAGKQSLAQLLGRAVGSAPEQQPGGKGKSKPKNMSMGGGGKRKQTLKEKEASRGKPQEVVVTVRYEGAPSAAAAKGAGAKGKPRVIKASTHQFVKDLWGI